MVIQPKTIRLRSQDVTDLQYLVLVAHMSEGAVIRRLLAQTAHFVRTTACQRQPDLSSRPEWAGGQGGCTWPADRLAWTAWCSAPDSSPDMPPGNPVVLPSPPGLSTPYQPHLDDSNPSNNFKEESLTLNR